MSCQIVFDVRHAGLGFLWFPAPGLLFVAVGIAVVVFLRRRRPVFSWLLLLFSIVWTTMAVGATLGEYFSLRHCLNTGTCQTVEGVVRNFVPAPDPTSGMKGSEHFDVAGRHFEYSEGGVTPGFNQTQRNGSPLGDGAYVRIWHRGGTIAHMTEDWCSASRHSAMVRTCASGTAKERSRGSKSVFRPSE